MSAGVKLQQLVVRKIYSSLEVTQILVFFFVTKGQVKSNSSDDSCDTFKTDVTAGEIKPVMYFRDTKCSGAMDAGIIITHT